MTTFSLLLKLTLISAAHFENINNACRDFEDYPNINYNDHCYNNPDVAATTPQIIKNHGFDVESHFVTTSDGYILQLFRIPPKDKNKPVIFFNHGIFSDSSAWVLAGERALSLTLAREGYDIWLYNHRGSIYSREHTTLDNTSEEYWNWTMDAVAKNDIPKCLEKIVNVTGKKGSIIYVGHSRGSILGFMSILNNPKSKILKGVVALAPVAYHDAQPHIKMFYNLAPVLEFMSPLALFQYPEIIITLAQYLCPIFPQICLAISFSISGESDQFLPDDLLNFYSHFPSPFSLKEFIHHGQMIESGRLQKFDYGLNKNLEYYGQEQPPIYDLTKIKIPVYLFYVKNDVWISQESVTRQFNDLGSGRKGIYKIPQDVNYDKVPWAHSDFLYGKDIQKYLCGVVKHVIEEKLS